MSAYPPPPPPPPLPPRDGPTLDLGRGFRFFFDDPNWTTKLLVGSGFWLLAFVIVGAFFLNGYMVRLIRRTARGEHHPLPEWDDLGGLVSDSLPVLGLFLAYGLGAAVVPGALLALLLLAGAGAGATGSDALGGLVAAGMMALYGLFLLLAVVLSVYMPSALVRVVMTGRFGAGFEFAENIDFIRRNLVNYGLALLMYLLASVAAQVGLMLCCVGVLPASFWAFCVIGWALGELARRDARLMAEAAAL